MATQGLVTIIKGGEVAFKIIVGCDGYSADDLVQLIKDSGDTTIGGLVALSQEAGFGCDDCRVIMDAHSSVCGAGVEDLDERYRRTFRDPQFNPRWERGTAEYVRVLELND